MTKAQKISEMIMVKFAETGDMVAAYDSVFGAGAYMQLAGEIYDTIRANAAK